MEARYRVPRTARITPAGGITPNFLLVEVYHTKFYHHNLLLRINQTQMHSIFTFSHFHIFELPHFQIATFQIPKPQNQISIGKLAHCFIGTFHFQIATFSNYPIFKLPHFKFRSLKIKLVLANWHIASLAHFIFKLPHFQIIPFSNCHISNSEASKSN
jgi:hypothetical protein